ncbi:hypothetical protein NYG90_07830 [Helicobacter sp. XJK30-2]|uniref:Uncharacterized protein n=2 Tax=Helicobacter zhangjianzhongii TaxID=2974574 RepID=A0ACC6FTN2_9HELI|nr:hypothetical protein [Helicobacter sp. XJK30-2]MDL0080635.1 hypothetical protein [Helicobacter sp. CPD2-1]MDL0082574.1 hypothetical protein [Helicobacter sp. XJK30-2]
MNALMRLFQRFSSPKVLESTSALAARIHFEQELLPFDLLGRSLSYNPYPPRFKEIFPTLDSPRGVLVKGFVFDELESIIATLQTQRANIIVLDLARDSEANPSGEGLECIGYLRHYTNALIVLKDSFIAPYQILQAVVYGADGIVLDRDSKGHKELLEFAFRLNCMGFYMIKTLKDIKSAVLAKAQGVFVDDSVYDELVSLIPQSKCICHFVPKDRIATRADFMCVQV